MRSAGLWLRVSGWRISSRVPPENSNQGDHHGYIWHLWAAAVIPENSQDLNYRSIMVYQMAGGSMEFSRITCESSRFQINLHVAT